MAQTLEDFDRAAMMADVRTWYNGYLFGNQVVYNPWSVLKFVQSEKASFQAWWIHTSGNELVREMALRQNIRPGLETLLNRGVVSAFLDENLSLRNMEETPDKIWSLLTFSGYLKVTGTVGTGEDQRHLLAIHNLETQIFFQTEVSNWAGRHLGAERLTLSLKALTQGDLEIFEDVLDEIIKETASYFDINNEPESFYHAFVLGMLVFLKDRYRVRSNRESGYGRYDVILEPLSPSDQALVIEFKKKNAKREKTWEEAMDNALHQIRAKNYGQDLKSRHFERVMAVGVVFDGKDVRVKGFPL